jgi:pyruvate/2-oxoglutarate dehydrogenase complex dihydrolipoamide acyltransferase (E2) component
MGADTRVEVLLPSLGISVVEGTIVRWRKRPGEPVVYEEPICDIATDKIESELPAPATGVLVEILVEEGETVDVGTAIAVVVADEERAEAIAAQQASALDAFYGEPGVAGGDGALSPVVARLAKDLGVDLARVKGTGAGGRVRKQDVIAAADQDKVAARYEPPPPVALTHMRRSIGAHMKRSLDTAATVTSWIEVDFSAVELTRTELGTTALPIVAKATLQTLAEHPDLNAWIDGERFTRHETVNLGIAVDVAGGLMVPVIHAAEQLSVLELANAIRDVAQRARTGQLAPDELADGTFTITNPGQFGTIMATPVISQPQVAILDVEAIVRRPVVVEEQIAIRPICILGLSWDHRAIDGALAARFLGGLRTRLEAWGSA